MTNQPYNNQPHVPPQNMKPCKHCKQMIDAKATVCPYCRKKQSNVGCLIAILIPISFFLFILILGAIGSSKKQSGSVTVETDSNVQNSVTQTEAQTAGATVATTEENKMAYDITNTSFNYYTNTIGSVEYYGIVEITNTGNCNISLDDCTFDLEDNNGHLLQTDKMISSCPSIVAPGEKGYFFNNLVSCTIDSNVSLDNGIKLVPNFKIKEARGEIVDYEVSDTDMREDNLGKIKITGRITNTTEEDCSYLSIYTLYKDADGKVIMIDTGTVNDLSAGSTTSFESSAIFGNDTVKKESIASYEVIARKRSSLF